MAHERIRRQMVWGELSKVCRKAQEIGNVLRVWYEEMRFLLVDRRRLIALRCEAKWLRGDVKSGKVGSML